MGGWAHDIAATAGKTVKSVTGAISRALAFLPGPWYAWVGGAAALAAILLGSRSAGAESALPDRPGGPAPLLQLGSTGPWVSYLQGLLGVPITGTFDQATDDAVRAYQAANAPPADGKVGSGTWGALGVTGAAPNPSPHPGPGPSPQPQPAPAPGPAPTPTTGNPFGLAALPPQREPQILDYLDQGKYAWDWEPLDYEKDGHQVHLLVSRHALALHDGSNRLIVSMTFNGAQQALDKLGAAMLTTRISDEIWKAAATKIGIPNKPWNTDSPPTGGTTQRMYDQSNDVQAKVAAKGTAQAGFVANEGKDWVITRRFWNYPEGINASTAPAGVSGSPHNAANFGWYPGGSKSPGGAAVIQSIGLAHDRGNAGGFVDYCLAVGTLVDTPRGHIQIEKLRVGDLVFTYNHETCRPDCSKVAVVKNTGIQPTMVVELDNGERVRCTANHRWLLVDGSECLASNLRKGDRLLPLRRSFAGKKYEMLYSRSSREYVYTHRAVGCAAHGLPIDADVLVHHLDENKMNNDPTNLEILADHQAHSHEHGQSAKTRAQWERPEVREQMRAGISRAHKGRPSWRKGVVAGAMVKCQRCGIEFYQKPQGNQKFCGSSCYHAFAAVKRRSGTTIKCQGCNTDIYQQRGAVRKYCSRECYWATQAGDADRNHRIVAIDRDGLSVPTFDIEVERDHNFALAAGVFVHNSQYVRGVKTDSLTIDGVPWDWGAALADPSVSSLIQDEGGTIPSPRHPDLA